MDDEIETKNEDRHEDTTSSAEVKPKRRNIIIGAIAAGAFAAVMFGGYLLNRHSSQKIVTPAKIEIVASPKIKSETIITATRNLTDTVYAKKGNTVWDIVRDNYMLEGNRAISQKVNEIAEYNHRNNGAQSEAMLDNRAVLDGKTVNSPDGIKFDHIHIGSRLLLPKVQRDDIAIRYFKDDKGNLYDENQKAISYDDLKESIRQKLKMTTGVTYDIAPDSDPIITTILTSLDGKKERLKSLFKLVDNNLDDLTRGAGKDKINASLADNGLAAIVSGSAIAGGNDPYDDRYRASSWDDHMKGDYSYSKLKSSADKNSLMAYMVDTYKNHTVKEATAILGMSRYQLYKTLDLEFGKGMMRKRASLQLAA